MRKLKIIRCNKGVTLIELLIVLAIIGILSAIGIPEYGRFIAKNKVRQASNDLLQNMRLARTMAIKENRAYLLTFNYAANNYLIGFDDNGNGALTDATDGYGSGAVRTIDIRNTYGQDIIIGSGNFNTVPPNGPGGADISLNAVSFQFNPDGTASPNGRVYIQHNAADRGYTFCVDLVNTSGMIDLQMWDGDADNAFETEWTELR